MVVHPNKKFHLNQRTTFKKSSVQLSMSIMKGGGIVNPKLFYIEKYHEAAATDKNTDKKTFEEYPVGRWKQEGDFYYCIRPLLQFGRLTGIIPISGLWHASGRLQYKWNTLAASTSNIVTIVLSANVIFSFMNLFQRFAVNEEGNAVDLAFAAKSPLFYLTVILIYIFFQVKAKTMIMLFSTWRKVSTDLKLKRIDTKLSRNIGALALSVYFSALIETGLKIVTQFPVFPVMNVNSTKDYVENGLVTENGMEASPLETYYLRSHPFWTLYVTYHPALAGILLVCNLISVHAWNYADIIIITFSRAFYFKFKALYMETDTRMVSSIENRALHKLDGITWTEVRRDHLIICKLLDDFEAFLSPLIFLSYTINIFFLCLQLHHGLTSGPDRNYFESLSSTWSFLHLVFRIMAISLTASKINEYAHQISVPIQKCSSTEYCKECAHMILLITLLTKVERLERMLGTGTLGLSGFGCFIITRALILVVVSVVFTIEIVLLQAGSGSTEVSATAKP